MGLDAAIRAGVSAASKVTRSLQCEVTHVASGTLSFYGKPAAGSSTTRRAIVEYGRKNYIDSKGTVHAQRTVITILGDVSLNLDDTITLPDGSGGPIADIKGVADPTTGRPYASEVILGETQGNG